MASEFPFEYQFGSSSVPLAWVKWHRELFLCVLSMWASVKC